jgi:hypothetical protein
MNDFTSFCSPVDQQACAHRPKPLIKCAQGIPGKGALLTKLSAHWFAVLAAQIPSLHTHFITLDLPEKLAQSDLAPTFQGRSMQVRRLKTFAIESIVRGYITGGAWSEYSKSGTVHGMKMPEGLRECEQMERPIWTPSTKAEQGEHDENISAEQGKPTHTSHIMPIPVLTVCSCWDCWARVRQRNRTALDSAVRRWSRLRGRAWYHHCRHEVRVWTRRVHFSFDRSAH